MIVVFSANSPVEFLTFKILLINETTVAVTTARDALFALTTVLKNYCRYNLAHSGLRIVRGLAYCLSPEHIV